MPGPEAVRMICGHPVDHETFVGNGRDPFPELGFVAVVTAEAALAEKFRGWGLDPTQRREVDFDGAEAQIYRIACPESEYFSPALLLIPAVKLVELDSCDGSEPKRWEHSGDLAIYRGETGMVHMASTSSSGILQELSLHLGSRVFAQVWPDDVTITCTKAGQRILALTILREAHGLFAYNHPNEN